MLRNLFVTRWLRTAAAILVGLAVASCERPVLRPDAVVTLKDGEPCFSVEDASDTRGGIPLYAITVNELNTEEDISQSVRWSMHIKLPHGGSISPKACVRYGEIPRGGEQYRFAKLKPYTTYSVFLDAGPEDSRVSGYGALFCLQPNKMGNPTLHTASSKNLRGRPVSLCRKPE